MTLLLNLGTTLNNPTLTQGSNTTFNSNYNTAGHTRINNLERDGGSNIKFGSKVNKQSIYDDILANNKNQIYNKPVSDLDANTRLFNGVVQTGVEKTNDQISTAFNKSLAKTRADLGIKAIILLV